MASSRMSESQAAFFRAEFARDPMTFAVMDGAAIEAELDKRWDAHVKEDEASIFGFDVKLESEVAVSNGVVFCGVLDKAVQKIPGQPLYLYRPMDDPTESTSNKRKRSSEEGGASASGGINDDALFRTLMRLKKDTLHDMCTDIDASVSGNKLELVTRFMRKVAADVD